MGALEPYSCAVASIREHVKKDGSTTFYVLWRDPDLGKQTSMACPTRPAAENVQRLLNANGQRLSVVESALTAAAAAEATMTLNEAFRRHLESPSVRANDDTADDYERMWRNRKIDTALGELPIAKITDEHIGTWLNGPMANYAHKTKQNTIGLLSSVFKTAVRRGWAESNPCELINLPQADITKRTATFLTPAEFWLLHDVFIKRHQLMLRAFVASGLRFSEMTALEVASTREALQRKVPALPVTRAWKDSKTRGWYLGSPKGESVRDVSIHRDLADEILEHIKKKPDEGLVFPNTRNTQLRNTTFHLAGWQDAVRAAKEKGLRKTPRPHDLRHTHASWMLAEGMSSYDLSKRLGHKSTTTTELIYGHLMQKAQAAGSRMIGEVMRRA